jgi:hypothetical protein
MMPQTYNYFNFFNISIFIGIFVIYVIYHSINQRITGGSQDGPLLAADGMLASNGLTSVSKGTIVGFPYNIMTNNDGSVMVLVQLGHDTGMHLIMYGDKSHLDTLVTFSITKKWLEPVNLEGDFPDYFHMYVSHEKQVEVREIFSPDVMASFTDFSRAYDLEIYHDSLFISQANGASDPNDSTSLVTDLEVFLEKNSSVFQRL